VSAIFILLVSAIFILLVSFLVVSVAIFNESAVLAESAILAESAAAEDDLLLQAAKEKAIAKAKTPTLNEFFMLIFFKVINSFAFNT
jgi:hypothetical protein